MNTNNPKTEYLVPCQPKREIDRDNFRTYAVDSYSTYDPFHPTNATIQCLLYRGLINDEIPNGVSAQDLTKHLQHFDPEISTRRIGIVLTNAVRYSPRKLKAKTKDNPSAKTIYVWRDKFDVVYGLEWQICMWLWKMEPQNRKSEIFAEFLKEIATFPWDNVKRSYIEPISELSFKDRDISWYEIFVKNRLPLQTEQTLVQRDPRKVWKAPKLKSLL